jgi:hypothetical protein
VVVLRPLTCWDYSFESPREHGCLSLVNVVCCQVEVSAMGWSPSQRSPTDCMCLPVCHLQIRTMWWPRPGKGGCATEKEEKIFRLIINKKFISMLPVSNNSERSDISYIHTGSIFHTSFGYNNILHIYNNYKEQI